MGTLLVTYAIASAAVSTYAAWIAVGRRRLARRVKRLKTEVGNEPDVGAPRKRAA